MKFALIHDDKVEATKGAKGFCPSCDSELIARCGEVNVNHWAHKGNRNCDPWWENETEWHRSWKGKFPIEWQEVVQFDDSGEKHIADVKTQSGCVLEFQHSYLNPEERRSRNAFYPKLIWVVDGLRRKTDKPRFLKMLKEEIDAINGRSMIIQAQYPDEIRLLNEWHNSNSLVFFDFQVSNNAKQSILWLLFPKTSSGKAFLSPLPRAELIESLNKNNFDDLINNLFISFRRALAKDQQDRLAVYSHPNRLPGFERYMANKRRRRRRF